MQIPEMLPLMRDRGFETVPLERGFRDAETGCPIEADGVFARRDRLG